MKICMVGLGSIGCRHLKNLCGILKERGIDFQVDALRSNDRMLPPETAALIGAEYFSAEDLPDDYDISFITNPTSLHYATIKVMILKSTHIFIEKPLFHHTADDPSTLPWKEGGVYYVACPLRYHPVIRALKQVLPDFQIYAARAICSTYLPDWRPETDYRKCYSASAELGGGVRIDLIHEWDYLQYLFGAPSDVKSFYGTYSHLEISSEDIAIYIASYPDKLVSLHLDYFGRKSRREIELYTKDDTITGDLITSQIHYLKSGKIENIPYDRDSMQRAELLCFLDMIEGKEPNHNDVNTAYRTLKMTLGELMI